MNKYRSHGGCAFKTEYCDIDKAIYKQWAVLPTTTTTMVKIVMESENAGKEDYKCVGGFLVTHFF